MSADVARLEPAPDVSTGAGTRRSGGPMDEQQSAPDGDEKPHAAGTPHQDKAYELPPPPAPGALWASPGDAPARSAPVPGPGGSTRPICGRLGP